MPNIPSNAALQALASNSFAAGAAGSIVLPALLKFQTVITGVIVSCGYAAAVEHGIWTISDGVWTQQFYILMSPTVPSFEPVPFAPGLYASAINTAITIAMPAIASGSPYTLTAQGYYI